MSVVTDILVSTDILESEQERELTEAATRKFEPSVIMCRPEQVETARKLLRKGPNE